jgi:UPF0271 protein
MTTLKLDINCDMGESYGAWIMGNDAAVLPFISSANIACGFHGGDPGTMRKTVAAAIDHGVAIGAHPSLPDLLGFGRREMHITPQEVYDCVIVQIGALSAIAHTQGVKLHHVKPHGALYNMAAKDPALAEAICRAINDLDPTLVLYGLARSELIKTGQALGLKVANEVFADRNYEPDGSLTPRSKAGAMIEDVDTSIRQVLRMVQHQCVATLEGLVIDVQADTLCLHGDQPNAALFAKSIRAALEEADIVIATI